MTEHQSLVEFLASAREPRTTAEIWQEITLAGQRKPPPDLPQTVAKLANAMLGLAVRGKVEDRQGKWHVVREQPKAERTLFQ